METSDKLEVLPNVLAEVNDLALRHIGLFAHFWIFHIFIYCYQQITLPVGLVFYFRVFIIKKIAFMYFWKFISVLCLLPMNIYHLFLLYTSTEYIISFLIFI